jgi:hypothetical protein
METIVKSRNLQFSNKQMKRTARTAAAYLVGLVSIIPKKDLSSKSQYLSPFQTIEKYRNSEERGRF